MVLNLFSFHKFGLVMQGIIHNNLMPGLMQHVRRSNTNGRSDIHRNFLYNRNEILGNQAILEIF